MILPVLLLPYDAEFATHLVAAGKGDSLQSLADTHLIGQQHAAMPG